MELILNILASDIRSTDYMCGSDCAITRALARAGRSDLKDRGLEIGFKEPPFEVFVHKSSNESYEELAQKVMDMYHNQISTEDFTHTLVY